MNKRSKAIWMIEHPRITAFLVFYYTIKSSFRDALLTLIRSIF